MSDPTPSVRPRCAADTRAVRRIARAAWRDTYRRIAPSAFIRAILRGGYGRERLVRGLVDARRDALIAEVGGRVVGYADVLEEPAGACELMRIYVDPASQGGGVGCALLAAACAGVARRGVRALSVAVDAKNDRAKGWYRRRGFVPAGRSRFDLGRWSRPQVVLSLAISPR